MDNNINYKLGQLTAGVEGMRSALDDHKKLVNEELGEIKTTLRDLNSWRFKIVGGVTVGSFLVQYIMQKIIKIL